LPIGYPRPEFLGIREEEMSDGRQYAPATLRNRDFILDVLRNVLPKTGVILESQAARARMSSISLLPL
jgi:hypothetical protein